MSDARVQLSLQQASPQRSFAATVAAARSRLGPAQRAVADYLVQAGPSMLLRSATEIATDLGVSDATVVRTAQALGFTGLPELRRAIAVVADEPTLAERLQRTLADAAGSDSVLSTSIENLLDSLDVLVQHVTPTILGAAVEDLASADRILWSGIGPSAALAEYACTLTRRLGHESTALTHSGIGAADELMLIRPGTAVVVLAYTRAHPHVEALITHASTLGVPVVLITDTLHDQLHARVAHTLITWRGIPGLFSSHATTVVLIEALVLGIARTDPERAEQSLALLNELRDQVS